MNKKGISFGKISFKAKTDPENSKNSENVTSGFGTFGRTPIQEPKEIEELADDLESQQIQQTIGFKNFGKKAKNIDIDEMVNQAKKLAEEVNKKRLLAAAEAKANADADEDDDDLIGPLPAILAKNEEVIGPPVSEQLVDSKKIKNDDEESDSYDELSGSDDEDLSFEKRIPQSHEVLMIFVFYLYKS